MLALERGLWKNELKEIKNIQDTWRLIFKALKMRLILARSEETEATDVASNR